MSWIYLSPHLDDVALSCGGLVWEQDQAGEGVSIWTFCAGEPPPGELSVFAQGLHSRWEIGINAPEKRRVEDIHSCQLLGAGYRHFDIPDCIYRLQPQTGEHMYASEEALTGPLQPGDHQLIQALHRELQLSLPSNTTLVCPLALGNHVDHQLARQAAETLGWRSWYYADYPYVLQHNPEVEKMERDGWEGRIFHLSGAGLAAWQDSIAAHSSQISTFWPNELEMRQAVSDYCNKYQGICLWRKPA